MGRRAESRPELVVCQLRFPMVLSRGWPAAARVRPAPSGHLSSCGQEADDKRGDRGRVCDRLMVKECAGEHLVLVTRAMPRF
jgi:hypothetical protein